MPNLSHHVHIFYDIPPRFFKLALNNLPTTPSSKNYVAASALTRRLNRVVPGVAFVKVLSGLTYLGGLEAMMQECWLNSAVALGEHWSFKYLVDLDGMGEWMVCGIVGE